MRINANARVMNLVKAKGRNTPSGKNTALTLYGKQKSPFTPCNYLYHFLGQYEDLSLVIHSSQAYASQVKHGNKWEQVVFGGDHKCLRRQKEHSLILNK